MSSTRNRNVNDSLIKQKRKIIPFSYAKLWMSLIKGHILSHWFLFICVKKLDYSDNLRLFSEVVDPFTYLISCALMASDHILQFTGNHEPEKLWNKEK